MVMNNTTDALETIQALTTDTTELHSAYLAAKQERDTAIREAISQGVTMYAIAKETGLSQTAIAKIRDNK